VQFERRTVASAQARHLRPDTPGSGEPATWGSGQRKLNRSWETWAPCNGRIRPSMQREEPPAMATGLERIAARARCEPNLRFTSLAHHLTRERVWENLCHIPTNSAPGVDGQTVAEAKESFGVWIEEMLQSVHRQGYRAPDIRRVYIPKPGKQEQRPLGVPCIADRSPAEKRRPDTLGHLRAGLSAVLFRWSPRAGCPSCAGNAP
jgi:hypothetical protein